MQNIVLIHVSKSGMLSVDFLSRRHRGVSKWRGYWDVSSSSKDRLRAIVRDYPASVRVWLGWSRARLEAYHTYHRSRLTTGAVFTFTRPYSNKWT
jgi:hypothetical protein